MVTLQVEIDTQIEFKRTLPWWQLLAIGLGAIIGAGIFVLSGQAASRYAGPSVIVSFILTGIIALFSALSFSELGAMMPLAGSVYTYTYAALGEYLAWFIGWNSILLYLFGVMTVTVAWSEYVVKFIYIVSDFNATRAIVQAPFGWNETTEAFYVTGQAINLPAIAITIAITVLLIIGVRVSKATGFRFLAWTLLGQVIYFSYGYWHSRARLLTRNRSANSMADLPVNLENNIGTDPPNEFELDLASVHSENEGQTTDHADMDKGSY
ncbi:unnamed protein product [Rotaria socialis]